MNDVPVIDGVFEPFIVTEFSKEFDRAFLIRKAFAVLEGKIQKQALVLAETGLERAFDRRAGNGERDRIGGESARRAAKHVARKLVEQNHARYGPLRRAYGIGQLEIGDERLMDFQE